jgi:hypothetical protein
MVWASGQLIEIPCGVEAIRMWTRNTYDTGKGDLLAWKKVLYGGGNHMFITCMRTEKIDIGY